MANDQCRLTAVYPPSTTRSCPFDEARSVAGEEDRGFRDVVRDAGPGNWLEPGIGFIHFACHSVDLGGLDPAALPNMPVTIAPGERLFTRIPFSPSSAAAERVSACTAPFDAV